MMSIDNINIAVIGLGYVGLPLAAEFGKQRKCLGYDINGKRVEELKRGEDLTLEVSAQELSDANGLQFTTDLYDMRECNVYIVTVPTPIDTQNRPDLRPLISASETVGRVLSKGDVVIFESTVYPGATEDECIPVIEQISDLKFNQDFFAGYSSERINPGDKKHRLRNIVKVTSGSTPEVAEFVDQLYGLIIKAGTFKAASIRVAEAAKVIENTQRDLNIALMNELAIIFGKLDIDTQDVLEAAGTKWNFLPFRPGLVGGHCIGVDPYYLTHKAQSVGYYPDIVLAGRRLNDSMGVYVADQMIKAILKKRLQVSSTRILVMGLTFKENCPDLRNTKVVDVIHELEEYGANVEVHDPWADPVEAKEAFGIELQENPRMEEYGGILFAVAHREFIESGMEVLATLDPTRVVIFDIKGILGRDIECMRL